MINGHTSGWDTRNASKYAMLNVDQDLFKTGSDPEVFADF